MMELPKAMNLRVKSYGGSLWL